MRASRLLRVSKHVFDNPRCLASNYRVMRAAVWKRELQLREENDPLDNLVNCVVSGSEVDCADGSTAFDVLPGASEGVSLGVTVNGEPEGLGVRVRAGDVLESIEWDSSEAGARANLEAKRLFWHSSAHLLGDAVEQHYDRVLLCDGPPILPNSFAVTQEGFFYEFFTDQIVSAKDFAAVRKRMKKLSKLKRKFEWLDVEHDVAREMFGYNPFKLEIVDKLEQTGQTARVFKCGDFIDLCKGPHIPSTKFVKYISLTQANASLAGDGETQLNRIYGISFPSQEMGKQWEKQEEEKREADHRKIGKRQNLFMFDSASPGSPFFLPDGAYVYRKLQNFVRDEYKKRGFDEVITPILYDKELWVKSGHWENYKDDMYFLEKSNTGLKPMNCPAHCLMFGNSRKSYKDLPVRFADFGPLHRNEAAGALSGLSRVRKFCQDDAHIFCSPSQVGAELRAALAFVDAVYGRLGFDYAVALSTRPARYVGEREQWDHAEGILKALLRDSGRDWQLMEGDGAFYGPKVDIVINDVFGRGHQCGTIQLDFQLPQRFNLKFSGPSQEQETPILIHRAVLGSVERMMSLLMEHVKGRWPLWLNPKQVAVIPVAPAFQGDADELGRRLREEGFRATVMDTQETLNKNIRTAQVQQFNYVVVTGQKEAETGQISVRDRDDGTVKTLSLTEFCCGMREKLE